MPAAPQGPHEASEGRSPLRRWLVRGVLLAGGTIAAWSLASGVASAHVAAPVKDTPAPGSSQLGDGGWLLGSHADVATPLARVFAMVPAVAADQPALPELDRLPAPITAPIQVGLPGGVALPRVPGVDGLPLSGTPDGQVRSITLPSGDGPQPHSGDAVAAVPAVAADVAPQPAARTSRAPVELAAGARPTSAATPDQLVRPPAEPADGPPCLPLSLLPAPPAVGVPAGALSAVTTALAAVPVSGWIHTRAPRHGPTSTWPMPDQPGTTPD